MAAHEWNIYGHPYTNACKACGMTEHIAAATGDYFCPGGTFARTRSPGWGHIDRMDASACAATAALGPPPPKAQEARGPASGCPPIGSILKDYESAANKAMDQFLATAGVQKSPRTIAEARKASEATRYYDKHGTEIFKGDHYRVWEGTLEGHWEMDDGNWNQTVASMIEVLSRADGTPVYRYKGGEDVRERDTYRDEYGYECLRASRGPLTRDAWLGCTLIRRAGESKPRGGHNWTCPCGELTAYSDGYCSRDCLDRFQGQLTSQLEELASYPSKTKIPEDWKRFPVATVEHEHALEAIERFLDWCNQPTLAQRFEAFKSRVKDVLMGLHSVTATFDFNQELGPFVVLRCKGILLEAVYDERSEKQISQKLDSWARDLGWDILRGK